MIYNNRSPRGLISPELELPSKRGIIRALNIKREKISQCACVHQKIKIK